MVPISCKASLQENKAPKDVTIKDSALSTLLNYILLVTFDYYTTFQNYTEL